MKLRWLTRLKEIPEFSHNHSNYTYKDGKYYASVRTLEICYSSHSSTPLIPCETDVWFKIPEVTEIEGDIDNERLNK